MNDGRNYFMINLHKMGVLPTRQGSNPHPPDLQSDAHPTEPPRPARFDCLSVDRKMVLSEDNLDAYCVHIPQRHFSHK